MFRAPPEVGVPGAAPAALQRQPVKFFGEALRHVGDVELQLELLGPDLVDGGIGKGQPLPATQFEHGIAALLVEPRGDAADAAEAVAGEANAVLAAYTDNAVPPVARWWAEHIRPSPPPPPP